jgi:hypothetical protein
VSGISIWGPFVLDKGGATEHGEAGVRVLDIYPAKCDGPFAEFPYNAEALLQFYKLPNKEVLCEARFSQGNTVIASQCKADVPFDVIGVTAVNSKDKWIAFDLR